MSLSRILVATSLFFAGPALAADVRVTSENDHVTLKIKRKKLNANVVSADKTIQFDVTGPAVVELEARVLATKAKPNGTLRLVRDGKYLVSWSFKAGRGRPAKLVGKKGVASVPAVAHLEVPAGEHHYEGTLEDVGESKVAIALSVTKRLKSKLALGDEIELEPPSEPAPPAAEVAKAPPPPAPVAEAEEVNAEPLAADELDAHNRGAEDRAASVGVIEEAPPAADAEEPAADAEPVSVESADGSVKGATQSLANAIVEAYQRKGGADSFHRVAVPYFQELGDAVAEHHLGKLVAELLSTELSSREPFVVVERERLDQIMREHRLKDLGIVDEGTAAEFGRILGAQSLISGTVAEAGPKFLVTVRQVDAEDGQVLAAGDVEIDRGGLVALSADAVVLRSKTGALFRSALIPGWGQLYNDQPIKALAFFGAGLGTVGSAGGFLVSAQSARAKYEKNKPNTVKYRKIANDRIQITNILLITYGVVWAANLFDAYANGTNATSVDMTEASGALSWRF